MLRAVELEPIKCAECGAKVSPKPGVSTVRCDKCGSTLDLEGKADGAPKQRPSSEGRPTKKKRARTGAAPVADRAPVAPPAGADAHEDDEPSSPPGLVAPPAPRNLRVRGSRPVGGILQGLFILIAALAVFGFVRAAKNDQARSACTAICALSPAYAGRNRTAPEFSLPDLDGNTVSLSSYRGKTVVLNFWSSTCGPCRDEMPSLAKLALILKGQKDVALVTITVDDDPQVVKDTLQVLFSTDPEAKEALAGGPIPFPVLFDSDLKVSRGLYGTTMYPETYVIDPSGFVRMRYDGPYDWSSPLALDAIESPTRGPGCIADLDLGRAVGANAQLCETE
jgi:thiol-disulfide isomerase/thioredoxin